MVTHSLLGLLLVLFVTLRVTGFIAWPWFFVLSPMLVVPAILLTAFVFYVACGITAAVIERDNK